MFIVHSFFDQLYSHAFKNSPVFPGEGIGGGSRRGPAPLGYQSSSCNVGPAGSANEQM